MQSADPTYDEPTVERPWLAFAAVGMAVFLGTVDGSIVNIALPTLAEEFDQPLAVVQWVALAYLLTQATLALLVGRLGDMLGKKRIFGFGFVIFTIFSVLAGLAPNIQLLIAARVLQGVGGAMTAALGFAILTETFPARMRGQVLGMVGAVVSIGIVTGPTLGGLILEAFSWRWIFLVNLPVGLIAMVVAARYVPDIKPKGGQTFDIGGAATFLTALLALLLGLSIGQEAGFGSTVTVVLLVVSVLGAMTFIWLERRVKQPVLDLAMFRQVDFSIGIVTGLLAFVSVGGLFIIVPFFLTEALGLPPSTVGLVVASAPIMIGVCAPISGRLSDRIGSRPVTVVGLAVVAFGYLMLTRIGDDPNRWDIVAALVPVGAGMGIFQSPNNSAVMGSVPRDRLGVAGSLLSLNRIVGQTIGIAALSAVWTVRRSMRLDALAPGEPQAAAEAGAVRDFGIVALLIVLTALLTALWAFKRERAGPSDESTLPAA